MNIGDTIWRFDQNRRIYPKGSFVGPIWREHWVTCKIIGETSRSWITSYYHTKIPKKPPLPHGWAVSREQIEQLAWVNDHRHMIGDAVSRVNDPALLRQIATLIGYKHG